MSPPHNDTQTIPQRRGARFRPDQRHQDGSVFLSAGTQLQRYMVLHPVARGGMGVVYAAYDPELDRKVAIKVLRHGLESENAQERLRTEARALAQLVHPNVVSIYDVGKVGDRLFIAMEFVKGMTLREWLGVRERGWQEILSVLIEAGRGLAAAHSAGIYHLDFKLANVMVTEEGGVRVLDFGLAQLERSVDTAESSPDVCDPAWTGVLGTPGYIPQERLDGQPGDARSDQFSFCVTLFRALTHGLSKTQEPREDGAEIAWPSQSDVPGWLREAVTRGVSRRPEDRFPSMDGLLTALSPKPRGGAWRFAIAGVLVMAALTGVAIYQAGSAPGVCSGARSRLDGIWDDARRSSVRAAFLATDAGLAEQTFGRVAPAIDQYAEDWALTYTDSCRATHVRGEQSERLLDLRTHCLNGRRAELRGLTDLLVESDRDIVAHAVDALAQLTPVATCSDLEELNRVSPLPADPESRRTLEVAKTALAEQIGAWRLGQAVDVDVAVEAVRQARELSYSPLEAEALSYLARWKQDAEASERDLHQALWAAIAGNARHLEAEIYVELVRTVGYHQARSDDGRWWGGFARASLENLENRRDLQAALEKALGTIELEGGRAKKAREHYLRAHEIGKEIWTQDHPLYATNLGNLALTYGSEDGEMEIAIDYAKRALAIREQAYGPWNPRVAKDLVNLASTYSYGGRYAEALPLIERSLEVQQSFYAGDHRNMVYPLLLKGQVSNAADRPAEAVSPLLKALELGLSGFGEQGLLTGWIRLALVDALLMERRFDEAEPYLVAARQSVAGMPEPARFLIWELEAQTGRLLAARGDYAGAAAALARVPEIEALDPSTIERGENRDFLRLLIVLGDVELARGRRSTARRHLEHALELTRPGLDLHLTGEVRSLLARALGPEERSRALDLARMALEDLQLEGSLRTRELRRTTVAWLGQPS